MARRTKSQRERSSSSSPQKLRKPPILQRIGSQLHPNTAAAQLQYQRDHGHAHPDFVSYQNLALDTIPYPTATHNEEPQLVEPSWLAAFRPRVSYADNPVPHSPIPQIENVHHGMLVREALGKFHLAVYLADEDAGESRSKLKQNLATICYQYMPAMSKLKIVSAPDAVRGTRIANICEQRKHHLVFFYHGRFMVEIGNELWDAMTEWEEEAIARRQEWKENLWAKREEQKRQEKEWPPLSEADRGRANGRNGGHDGIHGYTKRTRIAYDEEENNLELLEW